MKRKQTAWARFLALLDKWFPREKPRKRICGTCSKQIHRGERWHGKPPRHWNCLRPTDWPAAHLIEPDQRASE